jgi:hypothetical protein
MQQMRLHQQRQGLLSFRRLQLTVHVRVQMLPHRLAGSGVNGAVGGEWRSGHTGVGRGADGVTRVPCNAGGWSPAAQAPRSDKSSDTGSRTG